MGHPGGHTVRIFIADSDGGYRQPSRILGRFVDNLAEWAGAREAVRVQWPTPGQVNPRRSHTWESAAAAGVADVSRLVRLHPSDPLVLIGVCSGTRVIYDWMDAHPEDLDRVVAVGMIGDPHRPCDRWLDGTPDPGGQGVAGPRRGPIPDRTLWVSVPGDPLSGVLPDRLLKGVVRASTLAPDQVYDELLEDLPDTRPRLAARLKLAQQPAQWSPQLLRRLDAAVAVLATYREREYAALYESGEGGASPLARLGAAIVDRVEAHVREGGGWSHGARPQLSGYSPGMA